MIVYARDLLLERRPSGDLAAPSLQRLLGRPQAVFLFPIWAESRYWLHVAAHHDDPPGDALCAPITFLAGEWHFIDPGDRYRLLALLP